MKFQKHALSIHQKQFLEIDIIITVCLLHFSLVPMVRVTKVLPIWRMLNIDGAFTSYQSFFENGSTLKQEKVSRAQTATNRAHLSKICQRNYPHISRTSDAQHPTLNVYQYPDNVYFNFRRQLYSHFLFAALLTAFCQPLVFAHRHVGRYCNKGKIAANFKTKSV